MSDEHSLAILLSAMVGAVISVIVGYFVYSVAGSDISFGTWISNPYERHVIWWGFGGMIIGGLKSFIRQLERE